MYTPSENMLRSLLRRPIIARINYHHHHHQHHSFQVVSHPTVPGKPCQDHQSMSDPTQTTTPQPRNGNTTLGDDDRKLEGPKKKNINLLRGWPSASLLPAAALRRASQTALSDPEIFTPALLYGPDPGYQPLREELARWLGRFYGGGCGGGPDSEPSLGVGTGASARSRGNDNIEDAASRITITGGASQAVACILQSFTDPSHTRAVWMAAPCYFLACPIFADAGFAGRLRAVPEDAEGIDVGALERKMRDLEEVDDDTEGGGGGPPRYLYKDPGPHRKIYRHVVYCVPSFSNPSGKTMSLRRREALVHLARRHDALVICDDVYDMLQWPVSSSSSSSPQPLPRLADIDMRLGRSPHDTPSASSPPFGHAVSNGSFSKLVGPGVRTGWTYSAAGLAAGLAQTGSTRSGGAPSQLAAAVLCAALRAGDVDAHVRAVLRPAFRRRHALLAGAVRRELGPLGVRVGDGGGGAEGVFGGYFLWMTFPEVSSGMDGGGGRLFPPAAAVAERCRTDEDLLVGWGGLFEVHGDEEAVRFERDLRLCFAWEDEEDLVEGVERLARVVRKMLGEGPEGWGGREEERGEGGIDQMK